MNRITTEKLTRRQALGMLGATAFAASAMAAPTCAAAKMKIGCGTVTFRKS